MGKGQVMFVGARPLPRSSKPPVPLAYQNQFNHFNVNAINGMMEPDKSLPSSTRMGNPRKHSHVHTSEDYKGYAAAKSQMDHPIWGR